MQNATLHYIFDPLCGWCHGAAPLVDAARTVPGLRVIFHAGGMLTGTSRRAVTPQWRDYVRPHDQRISALTGQPFGSAYTDGLLGDTTAMLDSEPPTTAILAAEALAGRGLDLLRRLQQAHYVEGRRIADVDVLQAMAVDIGLDGAAFDAEYRCQAGPATQAHIADSRAWLARVGGQGFPTFALEQTDGRITLLDIGRHPGQPQAWRNALVTALSHSEGEQA